MLHSIHSMFASLILFAIVVLTPIFALGSPIGTGGANERSVGAVRQNQSSDWLTFRGTLSCKLGAENTGESCSLLFKDDQTGKVYHVMDQTQSVMGLFQSGKLDGQSVSFEGRLDSEDTVVVHLIRQPS